MKRTTKMAAVLAFALSAGLIAAHAQQKTMAIGTGGTGGVYYPLGGAIANVLSKNLPNVQATAEVTGGSVDNLKLIGTGQSEMGFTMADAALDAYKGEDKFKSGKIPLQALLVVYPNRMHIVTVESTGIKTMADLKGKRVSTGSPGGATEVMAFRVIEAAGLDKDKDMNANASASPSPSMPSRTARSTRSSGSAAFRPHRSPTSPPHRASSSGWSTTPISLRK